MTALRDWIGETFDQVLLLEEEFYDPACLGVVTFQGLEVAVYDTDKCIAALIEQGMNEEDAPEYFYFNTSGAYVGPGTPLFLITPPEE